MSTTTVRPAGIKCGNCHHYHLDVAAVKACHQGDPNVFTIEVNEANRAANLAADRKLYDSRRPLPTTGPLATEKQKNYLRKLCDERNTTLEHEANVATLTMAAASELIGEMLRRPKATQVKETTTYAKVPSGYYAIELDNVVKFFKVDTPEDGRWKGFTFLKVQASDEFYSVKASDLKKKVLGLIAKDPRAASLLYGQKIGKCGICNRTLTDETSRANGIGPICAGKMGW